MIISLASGISFSNDFYPVKLKTPEVMELSRHIKEKLKEADAFGNFFLLSIENNFCNLCLNLSFCRRTYAVILVTSVIGLMVAFVEYICCLLVIAKEAIVTCLNLVYDYFILFVKQFIPPFRDVVINFVISCQLSVM